jgi:SAM-dependent methyltransferase
MLRGANSKFVHSSSFDWYNQSMKKAYTSLAKYYDLIFQGKDYIAESKFIKGAIKKRKVYAKSILDIGCGTGSHLNLLIDDFEILSGIDLNSEIIKEAKKKSPKIYYQVAGMLDFKLSQKFDVIVCLYSVFNYNLTVKDAKNTLKNIKNHLNTRGLVIFALYSPRNIKKETSLHTGKNSNVEVVKINMHSVDPKTHIQVSDFVVLIKDKNGVDFCTEKGHKYRIYEIDEFTKMLRKVGFTNIDVFDGFSNKRASDETEYPVFVANLG